MKRRLVLALLGGSAMAVGAPAGAAGPHLAVFKNPSCGCCTAWVDHLKAFGFGVTVTEVSDTAGPRRLAGIPEQFGSCHTARVAGYAIEGHVPAADIRRLLKERPKAIGLAVPGMPLGSPGMEVPGGQRDRYDVMLIERDGTTRVWSRQG